MNFWNKNIILFALIFFLILFDFLFFNIRVLFINITLLRIVLLAMVYIVGLSLLKRYKLSIDEKISKVLLFFFFWLVYHLFLLFWNINPGNIYGSLYYLTMYLILITLIIILISNSANVIKMNKIFFLFGIITIFICLFEYFTGYHFSASRYSSSSGISQSFNIDNIHAVTGMFYNENDLSLFLMFIAPFFMINVIAGKFSSRILNLFFLSILLYIVIINDSKLILLSLAVQLIILIFIANISKFKKLVFTILILGITLVITNENLINGYLDVYNELVGGYGSNYIRLNLILNGFEMLINSYFLGVGPDNFNAHLSPFRYTGTITDPHNWWIELLAEYGILIFIGYITFFIWMVSKLFKIYKENINISSIALALYLGWIGFIIGSLAPSALFDFWPQWLMYGTSLATINVYLILKKQRDKN